MNQLPSKTLEKAVDELAKLQGIGKNTALRLALHIIKQDEDYIHSLSTSIQDLQDKIMHCNICKSISDTEICSICADYNRDNSIICVVENIKDVLSIEKTETYKGKYHILGGVISPIDGIGPQDINIESLMQRLENLTVKELIMALPTTIEGDTTLLYLYKKTHHLVPVISTLARGVGIGDDLEYIDSNTLKRSITHRQKYEAEI